MDEKLERLSSSVADKFKEAEQLNQQGDELEKKIQIVREQQISPRKLSQQKLEMASLQGEQHSPACFVPTDVYCFVQWSLRQC